MVLEEIYIHTLSCLRPQDCKCFKLGCRYKERAEESLGTRLLPEHIPREGSYAVKLGRDGIVDYPLSALRMK